MRSLWQPRMDLRPSTPTPVLEVIFVACLHGSRIKSGMTEAVIAGSTRNPSHRRQVVGQRCMDPGSSPG